MTAPAKASQGLRNPELRALVDADQQRKASRKPRQKTPTPTNDSGGSTGSDDAGSGPQKPSQSAGNTGGGTSPSRATPSVVSSDTGESVAGVILAAFFWGWVALPFLTGGVDGVKNMLRAKFLNKAPDGTYLP